MALLWETYSRGTHYCVRSAGGSIRLYSNNVFHSQWNRRRPFAGGIWDCLSLPVLYRKPSPGLRILLLGLGGGASVRQLQHLVEFASLVAVELDPEHINIARRWFGVKSRKIHLIEDDAISWLDAYHGPPFDVVVDDLFAHVLAEPVRAQVLTQSWIKLLNRTVTDTGVLVVNCVSNVELQTAAPLFKQSGCQVGYCWRLPSYENAVGVFLRESVAPGAWHQHLADSGLSLAMQRQAMRVSRARLI